MDIKDRLLSKVRIDENDCWLWQGFRNSHGYGHIKVNKKTCKAHRVSYEVFVAAIPDGLILMHLCDVPACINPAHLIPGTQKENMADAIAKGRMQGGLTHCIRGHEFNLTNTYWRKDRPNERVCKQCRNIKIAEYRKRAKELNP